MISVQPAPYRPDVISPPGATIRDMLGDLNMSQAELARRMGRPINKVNQIIQGSKVITAETALALEHVLGLPASFWLTREQNYRLALSQRDRLGKQERDSQIVSQFPYAEMAKLGWIQKHTRQLDKYRELLNFFGVASAERLDHIRELSPSFRKSQLREANPLALAAWLRKGMLDAHRIDAAAYDRDLVIQRLDELRKLTRISGEQVVDRLQQAGRELGLAVVFVPHLQKTYVGGAAFWLGNRPVIELSFRYDTNDHIWFNFFHELGHILLHSPKETWLDDFAEDQDDREAEANSFASDTLIPPDVLHEFLQKGDFSETTIVRFADHIGIAPGIVVGRLQRDGKLHHSELKHLKEHVIP
ncbi:XRE family transcriptional regulator [Planctomycetia bacterium]|nr:XRE family transcriptional regulator [Planctomycetia bacterium]